MKSILLRILVIPLLLMVTSCVAAVPNVKVESQWNYRIIPMFDFIVATRVPGKTEGWSIAPAYENNDGNLHIVEFVPLGQTTNSWSQMITITGYKQMNISPEQYFNTAYGITLKTCGNANTAAKVIKKADNMFIAILMCGKAEDSAIGLAGLQKGQGEITLYRIYKAGNTIYAIFHSWRGKEYDAQSKYDFGMPATAKQMIEYLDATNDTYICDKQKPEGKCKETVDMVSKIEKIENRKNQSIENNTSKDK